MRKIVALAELRPSDHVLEIGPGRGILTEALCHAAGRVTAVEVDPRLHAYLETRQAELPNVELVCEDALAYPVESLPVGTVVVANLPYYISTPLLFRLLDQRGRFPRMVLMLQAEVADRLVAKPWRVGLWGALCHGAVCGRHHESVSCLSPVFPPQTGGRLGGGAAAHERAHEAQPAGRSRHSARS